MERVLSGEDYKRLVKKTKASVGKIDSNCFLMASAFVPYADEGRLYAEEFIDGTVVYVDEGSYYNLYYYWRRGVAFENYSQDKPILVEEQIRGINGVSLDTLANQRLLNAGFALIRNNLQYELQLDGTQNYCELAKRAEEETLIEGLSLSSCRDELLREQVLTLWERRLGSEDVPWDHKDFMNRDDEVLCVVDASGVLAGTYWWRKQSKTVWMTRHVVTDERFVRRGIGSLLLIECAAHAQRESTQRLVTWISDCNYNSIAMHEKIGYRTKGNAALQYRLW